MAAREAALAAQLLADRQAHDDSLALRRRTTLAEIAERARRDAARYAAVSDREVDGVARQLLDAMLAEGGAP